MKSGLLVLSNGIKYGYPFVESINSILPVVDEMVVVLDINTDDGTREELEKLPVRIVPSYFDLDVVGWKSYGIMRTMGYHACKGDIVVMFDADGVVHEKDQDRLKTELDAFANMDDRFHAFWLKYRLYKPTLYRAQKKHSGIYKKSKLGDKFDFFYPDGRGIPNFTKCGDVGKGLQLSVSIFGYEHFFDTEEVFRMKTNRYGRMIDKHGNREMKTPEQYFEQYLKELNEQLKQVGQTMKVEDHPKSMQERLAKLDNTYFGNSWFGRAEI